jgi:hypothetical protein
MTRDEVLDDVLKRYAMAVSMLTRGALDELANRGIDKQASAAALQEILKFVVGRGPAPYAEAAETAPPSIPST